MKHLTKLLVPILIVIVSFNEPIKPDKVILDRLEYIYNLKKQINRDLWPDFTKSQFDVSFIYYTDSNCYVTNPTDRFMQLSNSELIYKKQSISIYKTKLLDTIPFHMETSISLGDTTHDYNYKTPFIKCSGPELTDKFVTDVHSTEMWFKDYTITKDEWFYLTSSSYSLS